jgi:hypothetical protein
MAPAAIFKKNAAAIGEKKRIAEDVLVSHGYKVRGGRGGGLTASQGGKYVATSSRPKLTATTECPHVAALVFNTFTDTTTHIVEFTKLASTRGSWSNRQQPW